MIFKRQRRLLELLAAIGSSAGNLDFQKLLLLYCHEPEGEGTYDFVPYKYGAFSFTSYADRRKLVERGLLRDDEQRWQLTTAGRELAEESPDGHLLDFARRYRRLRGDVLVAETYRRFPYYAIRSEMAARVLADDPAALARIDDARPKSSNAALCTIGYEGRTLESYLNVLLETGVTLLCDVRRNPISRKYGFSKKTLSKSCDGVGIRYEHLPDLGIAASDRKALVTQADYEALFAAYERDTIPHQGKAVARIRDWIGDGEHVALTCYERQPRQCHRRCVAEAVERQRPDSVTATHL